jgi:heme-degrading monooxygenase HmoA
VGVVLINAFELPGNANDQDFLAGWDRAVEYLQNQPGFVNTRLHRAVTPDARFRFVNVAEWNSPQDFAAAVTSEQFQEIASRGPAGTRALYEVVRSVQSKEE